MPDQGETTQNRSSRPDPKRVREARSRGVVPKSAGLSSALMILAGMIVLATAGGWLLGELTTFFRVMLGGEATGLEGLGGLFWSSVLPIATVVGVMSLGLVIAAVAANVVQVGFLVSTDPISPDVGRLSPAEGIKRLFSHRPLVNGGLSILRIALAALIGYLIMNSSMARVINSAALGPAELIREAGGLTCRMGFWCGGVLVAPGLLELAHSHWLHSSELQKSPQSHRDDVRRSHGHPLTQRRRREIRYRRYIEAKNKAQAIG